MQSLERSRIDSIGAALDRTARRNSDRTAIIDGDRQWSFTGLRDAAHRVASRLAALGLQRGDRVAAYGRNSDGYLIAWLGCAVGGFIHVPVNYALSGAELTYIIDQSGASAILYDPELGSHLEVVRKAGKVGHYGTLAAGPGGPEGFDILVVAADSAIATPIDVPVEAGDVAQLLYTSGTTAAPKGAMMTHGSLLAEYQSAIHDCALDRTDRALASLPLYHSAQMHVFVMPILLVGGMTLILAAPVLDRVMALVEQHKLNSLFAPPTVWVGLLRHEAFDRHDLSSLEKIYYGASIMPVPVLQELRQRLPQARSFNCYGQSEIGPLATVLRHEEHVERPASVGRPVLNVETRIVDGAMNDLPPGEQGEIVHRSPQLMIGYWGKADETTDAFSGGWFHSGDVGYLDEGGYLYVVDRIKDVINTGGVVVASREVEECIYTHPAVAEVAVVALPDPKWIEAIAAFVVLRAGMTASEQDIVDHVRGNLAHFKVPKRVAFVADLPRNTAGKLLKRELRDQYNTPA